MSKRPTASRGALWSAADFWTQQISQLLTFIVVGNLLGPEAVGIVTLGLVTVTLVLAFLVNGFSDALVQRARLESSHFDTAFWLLLGLGLLAGGMLWATAPAIARLFAEPQLEAVLPLLALGLPFVGVTAAYQGMLQRKLMFRALAVRSIAAYGSGFAAAVAFAWLGFGIYSLVAFFLVSRMLDGVLVILVSGIRPGLAVQGAALREIVGYGKHRVSHQVVGFFVTQIDRVAIGLFLGPAAVGLYSIAERMAGALTGGISGVLQRVAFPILAASRGDADAFDRATRDFLAAVNVISLPVFLGLALVSRELAALLFTPSWSGIAVPLAILSVAAIPHATNYVLTARLNARGRPDLVVRYSLVVLALRSAASLGAAQFGLEAVAWANLAVTALSTLIVVLTARADLSDRWAFFFQDIGRAFAASLPMLATVLAVGHILAGEPAILALGGKMLAGVASYAIALRLLSPAIFRAAPGLLARSS